MINYLELFNYVQKEIKEIDREKDHRIKIHKILNFISKTGWERVILKIINKSYEVLEVITNSTNNLYISAVNTKELIKQRKILTSNLVNKWAIGDFFYLPWYDSEARKIISNGLDSAVPVEAKKGLWHENDLLYTIIRHEEEPIALLILDKPTDGQAPTITKLNPISIFKNYIKEILINKRIIDNLVSYKNFISTIFKIGTDIVIETNSADNIVNINRAIENIFPVMSDKLINKNIEFLREFFLPEDFFLTFRKAKVTLKTQFSNFRYTRKGTNPIDLSVIFLPKIYLDKYNGMYIFICTTDVKFTSELNMLIGNFVTVMGERITTKTSYETRKDELYKWIMNKFNFKNMRLYEKKPDQDILICTHFQSEKYSYSSSEFNHPYNRNSLAANALLENEILILEKGQTHIRDIRRFWDKLKTEASIAIPIINNENRKVVVTFDYQPGIFNLVPNNKLIIRFWALILSFFI